MHLALSFSVPIGTFLMCYIVQIKTFKNTFSRVIAPFSSYSTVLKINLNNH